MPVRYKTFKYSVDGKTKSFEGVYQGDWSRADVERMFKSAMRLLPKHKLAMRRKDESKQSK